MGRTKWKGPYIDKNLLKTVTKNNINDKKEIKTFSRNSFIIPKFIGLTFLVHNGKVFLKIKITQSMLGHKLGEFSVTRKSFSYKKKKK